VGAQIARNRAVSASSKPSSFRVLIAFVILFALYQSAEGLGARLLGSFAVQAVLMIAMVLAAWPVGRWLGYRGYDAYGLDLRGRSFRLLVAMLLLAVAAKGIAILAGLHGGIYAFAPWSEGGAASLGGLFASVALSTFIPSIAEDMLTRGFLLRAANPGFGGPVFVLASAALFTANHIYRFDSGITEQLRLFVMGLAYTAAAWRWRTLWGAVGLHWGYNLAGGLSDPLISAGAESAVAGRWLTIAVHLALLAVILLIPLDRRDQAPS